MGAWTAWTRQIYVIARDTAVLWTGNEKQDIRGAVLYQPIDRGHVAVTSTPAVFLLLSPWSSAWSSSNFKGQRRMKKTETSRITRDQWGNKMGNPLPTLFLPWPSLRSGHVKDEEGMGQGVLPLKNHCSVPWTALTQFPYPQDG